MGTRVAVPASLSMQLTGGLFGAFPLFLGGILNTIAVAAVAAWRHPSAAFLVWLGFEILLGIFRIGTLVYGRREIKRDGKPPVLLSAILSCCWAVSLGYGAFLSLGSGDWTLSIIVCLSVAAMVSGMCLRNFGTPRLAATMVVLALVPCAIAGLLSPEPIIVMIGLQLPIFMATILSASFSLHKLLVSRAVALSDLERSESLNDTMLRFSPDYTFILDEQLCILFFNRPYNVTTEYGDRRGEQWLNLLPPEDRNSAMKVMENCKAGRADKLITYYVDTQGQRRWLDVVINRIPDGSNRIIVVARDITDQKASEEKALWMARHDALTGLPNRDLLQDRLDAVLETADDNRMVALLILDVDNFKLINDTLGHDAGDRVLCTFADRLRAAVSEDDMVARTGGDEFAFLLAAECEASIHEAAARIFTQLRKPIEYDGRLLECGASIGASVIPRDGKTRSEILKSADIALYAAKAAGRARLKIFEPAMMDEVEGHQKMLATARRALQGDAIVPHYQPIVSLHNEQIIGFEALLRWRDGDGQMHTPDRMLAAFEDPAVGTQLSECMLERVLEDVRQWHTSGLPFGHVAINAAASDFRTGHFVQSLLDQLERKQIPPSCIHVEVTESVIMGRGASYVENALQELSRRGIRISLDDFGTGYASLSHLNHFPVDQIKIDRSFIRQIGSHNDSATICAAVINLGHSLGLGVIAEGIETAEQEARLLGMRCAMGQGYLYSDAIAAAAVPDAIRRRSFAGAMHSAHSWIG
ncbi:putative signaling protein [Caenibius tardaugens NBRC 16725]|uniref:Putative signaling protein n=1 Tax=Caenibius tardaugens NBRC 16725 TaxID=1219035 RepID=U2ZY48_9SPHN|nr:bifunctional diguanylate cyclase/phosphodiesterase [Caenibius tardaugens]GAD47453.1 putative signaling protein [Caenibius tardaugens NBRC 16725]